MKLTQQREQVTVINNEIPKAMLISMFIEQADIKETTKEAYKKGLNNFMSWLEINNINQVEKKTILEYKYDLLTRYSPNTVNSYLTSVKAFYTYLEATGVSKDISRSVKGAKVSKVPTKQALTVEQAIILLNSFNRDTLKGKRDYAMLNLMINTGLRVMEVQSADVKDISQVGGKTVLYIQGKGRDSKDNFVVLSNDVLTSLLDYLTARGNNEGALFKGLSNRAVNERMTKRSISRVVKEAFKGIGLDSDKLTAHSTRHTAVTFSLLGGATVQEAQAMARHSDINTTMIYSHNINRIENNAESNISALLDQARKEGN